MDTQLWPKKRSCFSITPMSQVVMWQYEEEWIPLQKPNQRQATWHMLSSDLLGCWPKPLHCKRLQIPWPPEESKPTQMWMVSRRGNWCYQTQSQCLSMLIGCWLKSIPKVRSGPCGAYVLTTNTPCLWLVGGLHMVYLALFSTDTERGAKFYIFSPNSENWGSKFYICQPKLWKMGS